MSDTYLGSNQKYRIEDPLRVYKWPHILMCVLYECCMLAVCIRSPRLERFFFYPSCPLASLESMQLRKPDLRWKLYDLKLKRHIHRLSSTCSKIIKYLDVFDWFEVARSISTGLLEYNEITLENVEGCRGSNHEAVSKIKAVFLYTWLDQSSLLAVA